MSLRVGTAGWSIPRAQRDRFPFAGTHLERYSSALNATEINSSFHRPHAYATYERWASAVPPGFRFAVKMPKLISHDRLLMRARDPLKRFLDETAGLGAKRGPLLLQLPPSLAFDLRRAGRFFDLLRSLHQGPVACEPRHPTWTTAAATRLLQKSAVARVAADPARADGLEHPGGWDGLVYYRWHGSPRVYFSSYSRKTLATLAGTLSLTAASTDTWCVFDNTASGSASENALDLINLAYGHPEDR